ncbi:MAG: LysM peptidoglycan-binding domain-containing protein [Chloroflexota bacterium]|mgnify:CR=1 FL=1
MARKLQLVVLLSLALSLARPMAALADDAIIHTVQPGENLFRIGLRYGVTWQAIMQANGLSSTYIYVGQQLRIPTGATTAATAPVEAAAPVAAASETSAASAPAPSTGSQTYTVQRGDTLWSIARKFSVTTGALASANNIFDPSRIYAGQVLTIPAGGATLPAPSVAPASTGASKTILVDISEQHMYVYEGGGLIWSWVTSTGERGRDTVPGNFSVLNKIPNAYAYTWNLQMPYWLGIYWAGSLQNGIHALPILSNGETLWAGWLGTPVSYGCVILSTENAATLYNWAEVGTPVKIQW